MIKKPKRFKHSISEDHCNSVDQTVKWTDAGYVRSVSERALKIEYGLNVTFHPNRLCPPIPNRANYIKWLKSIFATCKIADKDVFVLDVGTGASCIYPLLGSAMYGWRFLGSDIDEQSLKWAKENVLTLENPSATPSINVVLVSSSDSLQTELSEHMIQLISESGRRSFRLTSTISSIMQSMVRRADDSAVEFCADGRSPLVCKQHLPTILSSRRGPVRTALAAAGYQDIVQTMELQYLLACGSGAATAKTGDIIDTLSPKNHLPGNHTSEASDITHTHTESLSATSSTSSSNSFLLTAVMCNPPFYDLTSEVIIIAMKSRETTTLSDHQSMLFVMRTNSHVCRFKSMKKLFVLDKKERCARLVER